MRKLVLIISVIFLILSIRSNAQDNNPLPSITVKKLVAPNNPTFYYDQSDSLVKMFKGAYEWTWLIGKSYSDRYLVPYDGANRNVNLDTMALRTGYIDLVQQDNPIHGAYRLFADTTAHTLGFYNDEADITMQIGSEMWSRIYNNSGSNTINGSVVRITGSSGDTPTINLASNDFHVNADGVLGVATHDIETNTYGFITTIGEVHGLNTSACPEGAILYLGINGAYTHIRPLAPNFVVEIGTCLFSDATDGTILVNIKGSPYDIVHNSFNDIFLESMVFRVTSNGTTTIGTIERRNGGDLTMQFSNGFSTLDCTPAATVTLTAGTATVPQTNYIYVPKSTGLLTASTSGWPSDEHIKVAEVACRTSALTQIDGVLRNQNWNDHIAGSNGSGHISHINERIRRLNADWYSGVAPTLTIVSAANPDNVYFSNTGGKVYQMHQQDFPAQSMPTNDIHVVNHFTTPYITTTNLNTQLTDAVGGTLASKSYSLVIWGIQNESGELSHLMVNLPIGSYLSATNAIQDADNYSVYTIPNQFKGVGFLIARITLSHNPSSSGTWTLEQTQDLRGYFPNNTAGSGSSGSGGGVTTYLQLLDTPNSYASSANKLQGVNSGETAIESKAMTVTLAGTANIPTGQQYQINGGSIIVDAINDAITTTAPSQNSVFDALALKENISNKENTTIDNSTTKYPTVNLLKTYADTKQLQLNGTGFVKASGTVISYDNSTYEPAFSKNTAFNKNFGTTSGTVLEGRAFGTAANSATTDFVLNGTSLQTGNFNLTGNGIVGGYFNAPNYLLNNNNLFSGVSNGFLSYWNGIQFIDSKFLNTLTGTRFTSSDIYGLQIWRDGTPTFASGIGIDDGNLNFSIFNGTTWNNRVVSILHTSGAVKITNLSGTGTRLTTASADGTLGAVADGTNGQVLQTNGSGVYSFVNAAPNFNYTVQTLSGTTPTFNTSLGFNATLTMSGNTTITFSNLVSGSSGWINITNTATLYTLDLTGYNFKITQNIYGNTGYRIGLSGGSQLDRIGWSYDGTVVVISGSLSLKP